MHLTFAGGFFGKWHYQKEKNDRQGLVRSHHGKVGSPASTYDIAGGGGFLMILYAVVIRPLISRHCRDGAEHAGVSAESHKG